MSDQIPAPSQLYEIGRLALMFCEMERRLEDSSHVYYSGQLSQARLTLMDAMNRSGACRPFGWPYEVMGILHDLNEVLFSPTHLEPHEILDLEERVNRHLSFDPTEPSTKLPSKPDAKTKLPKSKQKSPGRKRRKLSPAEEQAKRAIEADPGMSAKDLREKHRLDLLPREIIRLRDRLKKRERRGRMKGSQ
jgi:hypothetical protein